MPSFSPEGQKYRYNAKSYMYQGKTFAIIPAHPYEEHNSAEQPVIS